MNNLPHRWFVSRLLSDLQLGHDSKNEITLFEAPGKGNYLLCYLVLKCF